MNQITNTNIPPLYDAQGKVVTDLNNAPSGTSLRDVFGSSFVISREGDTPTTKKTPPVEELGPEFV